MTKHYVLAAGGTGGHMVPAAALADYRERILRVRSRELDAAGLAALEEDLRSPCHAEIAVFQEFSHAVAQSRSRWVVSSCWAKVVRCRGRRTDGSRGLPAPRARSRWGEQMR